MRNALRYSVAAATLAAFAIAPRGVGAGEASPPTERAPDHYLDIPGIGPIPIPLPPGARVFNPPRRLGPPVGPAPPSRERDTNASGQRKRDDSLDVLFARLAGAGSEEEARAVAGSIARLWARSGSETADLLRARAAQAASLGDLRLAIDIFDRIVALEPSWPEAFVARANARLLAGDVDGAERDFATSTQLEPRRFDAFAAIGALRELAGAAGDALAAYRRALALDPHREDWRDAEERLRLKVEGRDI